jgi:Tfp pilus assembly protein PilV
VKTSRHKSSEPIRPSGGGGRFAGRGKRAFTLMEVMIAIFIFFVALFAILELVSQNLRIARGLYKNVPHAGMLAAELSLTNKLEESAGTSGDFGELYPGWSWDQQIALVSSNGLFQVDFKVYRPGGREAYSELSLLLYRPESVQGAGGAAALLRRRNQ